MFSVFLFVAMPVGSSERDVPTAVNIQSLVYHEVATSLTAWNREGRCSRDSQLSQDIRTNLNIWSPLVRRGGSMIAVVFRTAKPACFSYALLRCVSGPSWANRTFTHQKFVGVWTHTELI